MANPKTGPGAIRPQNRHLIPLNERTPEERAAIQHAPRKKRAEDITKGVRRKTAAELMRLFCDQQITDVRVQRRMAKLGVNPDDLTNLTIMVVAVAQKAQVGDIASFEKVLDLIGEKGIAAENHESNLIEALYGMVEITKGLVNKDAIPEIQRTTEPDPDLVDAGGIFEP